MNIKKLIFLCKKTKRDFIQKVEKIGNIELEGL